MNSLKNAVIIGLSAWALTTGACAAVTADEAKQLGANLTPFGAEKAGNADGSIPAYNGAAIAPPAGYKPGSGRYPDPYASEKILVTIDAKNLAQYKDQVPAGVAAMLQQYPTFHLNVYPSHRNSPYPQWVLDNSIKNATKAELTGQVAGDAVKGVYGGIPFPIPKNGYEVIWNFLLRYTPADVDNRQSSFLSDASGRKVFLGDFDCLFANTYYDPKATGLADPYYFKQLCIGKAPVSAVGYNIMLTFSTDYANADQLTWVYTPGQRRVRTAPEFSYDTPAANFGGALTYDEVNIYSGRMDRFDMKLVGKREMLIPYDNFGLFSAGFSTDKFLTPKHPNPDMIRWEKHRVWVVEATLKAGKRHALSRRTFYVDEDSWQIVATDGYDQAGKLYRVGLDFPSVIYGPDQASYTVGQRYLFADLTKGEYFASSADDHSLSTANSRLPDLGMFTSSRLAATGIR
jgi:hypothetical protein